MRILRQSRVDGTITRFTLTDTDLARVAIITGYSKTELIERLDRGEMIATVSFIYSKAADQEAIADA